MFFVREETQSTGGTKNTSLNIGIEKKTQSLNLVNDIFRRFKIIAYEIGVKFYVIELFDAWS